MTLRNQFLMATAVMAAASISAGCRAPGAATRVLERRCRNQDRRRAGQEGRGTTCSTGADTPGRWTVAGLPSMRHISTIPVFAKYPGTGYGYDEESRQTLGDYTWGDVHHPGLSQTDGRYDGRWLFVNDNANNRVARVDLRDFKTRQIFGPIPNSSGNHQGRRS